MCLRLLSKHSRRSYEKAPLQGYLSASQRSLQQIKNQRPRVGDLDAHKNVTSSFYNEQQRLSESKGVHPWELPLWLQWSKSKLVPCRPSLKYLGEGKIIISSERTIRFSLMTIPHTLVRIITMRAVKALAELASGLGRSHKLH